MDWVNDIQARLAASGLNVCGIADGRGHGAILPGCRSVLVFASGGTALWDAMHADVQATPAHLTDEDHPLDAFVARQVHAADPSPPPTRRWIHCSAQPEAFVDFRPLAHDAGLGWTSQLGLLLHPTFGPWLGLRAACFTTESLPITGPVVGASPCDTCPDYCATACPGGAFSSGAMNIRRCSSFHLESDACHGRCHARLACPIGSDHRHGPLQHHYHNARSTGRRLLADSAGISDDARTGDGPHWAQWASDP